jgi:hypothetical protein
MNFPGKLLDKKISPLQKSIDLARWQVSKEQTDSFQKGQGSTETHYHQRTQLSGIW